MGYTARHGSGFTVAFGSIFGAPLEAVILLIVMTCATNPIICFPQFLGCWNCTVTPY